MSLESSIAFFIAILVFSVTPGPGVFALLARAMIQDARSCLPLAFGMAVSDVIYLVLASFGLAVIANNYAGVFTLIRIGGAVYLVYLGWKMWRDRSHLQEGGQTVKRAGTWSLLLQGFVISASNPKVILFYIAFLPTFMDLTVLQPVDIALASVLCLSALMIGLMAIAYGAAWARSYFRSTRAMTGLNRLAGSIMMTAGVYLGTRG